MKGRLWVVAMSLLVALSAQAQDKFVSLKYGDMDHWVTRRIHESAILGGKTKQ